MHGPDHVFENNAIIEHGGPWAGPMAFASAVNTRNTTNAVIRGNFIHGQGNNKWNGSSVFMVELYSTHQGDSEECMYGGQAFENNMFANITRGTAIYLGRGGCIMKDIKITGNIFKTNLKGAAIRITTPHENLIIKNNIFYDQDKSIDVYAEKGKTGSFGVTSLKTIPSNINISNNVFMNNRDTIDSLLFSEPQNNNVSISNNLFFRNIITPDHDSVLIGDPKFINAEELDFRTQFGSACIRENEHDIGVYDYGAPAVKSMEWWRILKESNGLLEPGMFN